MILKQWAKVTKETLAEIKDKDHRGESTTIKTNVLAALLRIGDELDISGEFPFPSGKCISFSHCPKQPKPAPSESGKCWKTRFPTCFRAFPFPATYRVTISIPVSSAWKVPVPQAGIRQAVERTPAIGKQRLGNGKERFPLVSVSAEKPSIAFPFPGIRKTRC